MHGVWNKGSEDVENQSGRLLWSSEKVECKVPNIFWTNPGDPPSRPCAWGFTTRVQGKGSKHGFRVMVQRTGKTLFGRLLWAFRESG